MAENESLFARTASERAGRQKASSIGYYDLEKNIGEGNFAKVKLATHILTGQKVAVKIIDKNKLDKTTAKKLFREVRIMKLLNHKNIVRLYEVIDTPDELYLIMEYVSGGEIFDFLVTHGRMKEKEARKHFRQIVGALAYCHNLHIIHRDLKAENLLLDESMNVKIADFGFSNQFSPGQRLNTWCGSPPYAAPELFQGKEYAGPEVDIWSLGVVLYVLVCGSLPFDGSNLAKLRARVISGKFKIPFYMSPDCERLIKKMLVIEPSKRCTIEQVMQDKWFTEGMENEKEDISPISFVITPEQHRAVLDELEEIGLDHKAVETSLNDGNYDALAATYYLVADKRYRQKQNDALPGSATSSSAIKAEDASKKIASTPNKTSKATGLVGIDEEGAGGDNGEHKRHATEPMPGSASGAARGNDAPGSNNASTTSGKASGAASGTNARPPSSSGNSAGANAAPGTVSGGRRRATVTASPMTASEMRKEIQSSVTGGAAKGESPASESAPSEGKELPPPRVIGRVPSARSRASQIASEFKPKIAEPALAQIAATPPEAPQLLPPIPAASSSSASSSAGVPRGRAHTLATNTARPQLDQNDDTPIPIEHIRKHLGQAMGPDEPRTARFTFSLNTTSTKESDQLFAEVVRVLKDSGVQHTAVGLIATCKLEEIEFELEICRIPNLAVNGLRFKRLAGNTWDYKDLITNLIAKMNL